jgi:hypothetical protein
MKQVKYSIRLGLGTNGLMLEPIIENTISSHLNSVRIRLSDDQIVDWIWCPSYILIKSLEKRIEHIRYYESRPHSPYDSILSRWNNVIKAGFPPNDKVIYSKLMRRLFYSFRSGIDNLEMLVKLKMHLCSSDWTDWNMARLPIRNGKKSRYRCKIEPLYGFCANFLSAFNEEGKERVNLTQWLPENLFDYEVIWVLLVTLSNGEKSYMQFPVCSANRWLECVNQYFKDHPQEIVSPEMNCGITHAVQGGGYDYKAILKRLNEWIADIVGSSPTEVLIKLSSVFNDRERKRYLKKILSGREIEMVFTGQVVWVEN